MMDMLRPGSGVLEKVATIADSFARIVQLLELIEQHDREQLARLDAILAARTEHAERNGT